MRLAHHQPLHHGQSQVPPLLSEAIQAFILAIAARRVCGQLNEHNSMLAHMTRFTSVQAEVKRQVEEELRRITRRLRLVEGAGTDTVTSHLPRLWEKDFIVATEDVIEEIEDPAITILSWEDVEIHIPRRRKTSDSWR